MEVYRVNCVTFRGEREDVTSRDNVLFPLKKVIPEKVNGFCTRFLRESEKPLRGISTLRKVIHYVRLSIICKFSVFYHMLTVL